MVPGKAAVLFIDDELMNLSAFKANFRKTYDVHTAASAEDGLKILGKKDIQVIISDQRMPGMDGVTFFESIVDIYPDPVRILLTGYSDIQATIDAINKGRIFRYLSKPWNNNEIERTIEEALQYYYLMKEKKELTDQLLQVNEQLEFMLRQKLLS